MLSQRSFARKSKSSRPRAPKRKHLAIFTAINTTTLSYYCPISISPLTTLLLLPLCHHYYYNSLLSSSVSLSTCLPNRYRHLTIALLIRSGRSFLRCVSPSSRIPCLTRRRRHLTRAHCDLPLHLTPAYLPTILPTYLIATTTPTSDITPNTDISIPSRHTPALSSLPCPALRTRHLDSSTASPTHHITPPPPPIHVYNTVRDT